MLKIKDNVDLKELENHRFIFEDGMYTRIDDFGKFKDIVYIFPKTKEIMYCKQYKNNTFDIIKNTNFILEKIIPDLVEKAEEVSNE